MYSKPPTLLPFMLFIVTLAAAVMLWWTNTVLSMILVILGLSSLVFGFCQGLDLLAVEQKARESQHKTVYSTRYLDQFMQDLSERMERDLAEAAEEEQRVSLAEGIETLENGSEDIHRIPPSVINGIGREYSDKLASLGITRIEQLADANPEMVADHCRVNLEEAEDWVFDAAAIVHGARISSIIELSMSVPEEILERIDRSLREGKLDLPDDYEVSMWSVRQWIEGANRAITGKGSEDMERWWRRRP